MGQSRGCSGDVVMSRLALALNSGSSGDLKEWNLEAGRARIIDTPAADGHKRAALSLQRCSLVGEHEVKLSWCDSDFLVLSSLWPFIDLKHFLVSQCHVPCLTSMLLLLSVWASMPRCPAVVGGTKAQCHLHYASLHR